MEPCGTGKTVLISVYVERPRNKRLSFHKPCHSYKSFRLTPSHHYRHGKSRTGCSKKAQLLLYIQQKREKSRQSGDVSSSRPSLMSPLSSNNIRNQPPRTPTQAVAAKIKPKSNTFPSCLGKWKLAVPVFLKSVFLPKKKRAIWSGATSKKIKVIGEKFQVQKRCRFIPIMLASLLKSY